MNDLLVRVMRVALSTWFTTLLGVLILAVGLPWGERLRDRWRWRAGILLLGASFIAWPRLFAYLARDDLEMVWILILAAAFLTFVTGARLAAGAWFAGRGPPIDVFGSGSPIGLDVGRPTLGSSPWFASAILRPRDRSVEFTAPVVITVPEHAAPPTAAPSLDGVWTGRDGDLEVRLTLTQTGSALSGTGDLSDALGGQHVEVAGSTLALPSIELTLGAVLSFVGRLAEGPVLRGRLLAPGASPRALTLAKER